jgi:hypothetical protein
MREREGGGGGGGGGSSFAFVLLPGVGYRRFVVAFLYGKRERVLVAVFFDDGSRLIFSRAVTKVAITAYHKKGIIINSKISVIQCYLLIATSLLYNHYATR